MKHKRYFLLILAFIAASSLKGQEQTTSKPTTLADIALSGSGGRFSWALEGYRMHGFGRTKKFKLGYGIRFTSFVAANKYYTTAPAKYTSPVQNIGTIFSETFTENIDTITTATAVTNSLNAAFHLHYDFNDKWGAGTNIDVIGFSFGRTRSFNIISSVYDPNQAPIQKAQPTRFNLLLTSDNDIGSLNSEFYVRYAINPRVSLRAGYTFLFSEYRTERDLSFDGGRIVNDRYRNKAAMGLLAVSLKPFQKI